MHLTTITPKAKKLLPKFKAFPQFYLVGGTALALQLGHRVSVDFDWFTEKSLPRNLPAQIKKIFGQAAENPEVKNINELTLNIGGIKTTFFRYPFQISARPVKWLGLRLASVSDIALMKAYVFGQRLAFKDYVDLYFILKRKEVSLTWLVDNCKKIYGGNFNARLFLEQVLHPEDIAESKIKFTDKSVAVKRTEIQKFFETEISAFKL